MFAKIIRYVVTTFVRIYLTFRILMFRLYSNAKTQGKLNRRQPVLLVGSGEISFTGKVVIGYFPSPDFLSSYAHLEARKKGARISIGNGTHINNRFCAIAEHSYISIGENCRIGYNVEMLDSDFHGLEVHERSRSKPEWAKPITIGNDVFIGANAKILKGVSIGDGAVIAHSSVITKSVEANTVVAGNPAKVVKLIGQNVEN